MPAHFLALHVVLLRPPQPSLQRIDGDRHIGVLPADLHLLGYCHPARHPHPTHPAAQPQPYLVALHNALARLQPGRGPPCSKSPSQHLGMGIRLKMPRAPVAAVAGDSALARAAGRIAMPGAGMPKSVGNGPTTTKSANISTRNMIPPTSSTCWRGASSRHSLQRPWGIQQHPGPPAARGSSGGDAAVPGADRAPAGHADRPDHRGLHLGTGGLHPPRLGLPGSPVPGCVRTAGFPLPAAVPPRRLLPYLGRAQCARHPVHRVLRRPHRNKAFGEPLPASLRLRRLEVCAGRSTQATLLDRTVVTCESLYLSPAIRVDRPPGRHG